MRRFMLVLAALAATATAHAAPAPAPDPEIAAIVAKVSAERLKALIDSGADAKRLRALCQDLLDQIDRHFEKEEQVLFPMCRALLDAQALRDVARAMEAGDAR